MLSEQSWQIRKTFILQQIKRPAHAGLFIYSKIAFSFLYSSSVSASWLLYSYSNCEQKSHREKENRILTETHCWPMNRVLYGYKISPQNANNTWLSLNMLNSFLAALYAGSRNPNYSLASQSALTVSRITLKLQRQTFHFERIINEISLFTQCFTLTLEEVLSTLRDC